MKKIEKIFFDALSDTLSNYKSTDSVAAAEILNSENPADTVRALFDIARKQKVVPLIYDFICIREIDIPAEMLPSLKQEIASYALVYYQNKYFTEYVCRILEDAGLPYALIKGLLLSELYPKPECRRYSDVDILVNEKASFQKAAALFEEHGFQRRPSNGDHHHEYIIQKNDRVYLIELHQNLISSQQSDVLNEKVKNLYDSLKLDKTLPVTLDALYLLLHMLQHLLDAGFGVKLLCDWVLYLEQKTDGIDSAQLRGLLEDMKIFTFAENITAFCVKYLGLTRYPGCFFCNDTPKRRKALEALSEDIFAGGEYGKNDSSRMIMMRGQFRFSDYFMELHRQTKKNYPRLHKTILPLPVLWCLTGLKFLYNNKQVRHTDTKTILETTKKRQKLLDHMDLNY